MKSYQSSTATLRSILADPALNRDQIEETMHALADANASAKEVDEAIKLGGEMAMADADMSDADLDEELAELLKEAVSEQTANAGSHEGLDSGQTSSNSVNTAFETRNEPDTRSPVAA